MISDSHNHHHIFAEKMQRCQEYVEALQEERRKIQVFERELPLCLELVTQAIEACKQQLSGTTAEYFHAQSECSEQTSSQGPFLEEFIPIKRTSPSHDDDDNDEEEEEEEQSRKPNDKNKDSKNVDKSSKKLDWLRSVQLWNQTPDPPTKQDSPKKVTVAEVKGNGGAFHPFKREKSVKRDTPTKAKSPSSVPPAAASSTAETRSGGTNKKEEKEGQSQRKSRRSWSPELHRRFLHALQQLGGSHVATPKQIREVMKVDGLTNDEVKSHLQKYRLHTRKPSPSIPNNNNPPAPQFVVVGGIWVQPPEYAAVAAAAAATAAGEASGVAAVNGIYAPIAAPPPPPRQRTQRQQPKKPGHSEDGVHSNSPATSSSTHTSMVSPKR